MLARIIAALETPAKPRDERARDNRENPRDQPRAVENEARGCRPDRGGEKLDEIDGHPAIREA
jgi:hypothetical protein